MSPLLYLNKDTSYIWNRLLSGCQHLEILETHCKCERRLSNLAAGQALNILKTRAPSHPSACFDFVPKLKKKKRLDQITFQLEDAMTLFQISSSSKYSINKCSTTELLKLSWLGLFASLPPLTFFFPFSLFPPLNMVQ